MRAACSLTPVPGPHSPPQCLLPPTQYKWESQQSNSYSIKEDTTDLLEGSGTRIVLHLKEDSEEYLDDFKVRRHQFMHGCHQPHPLS